LKSPGCALKVDGHYAGMAITVAVTDTCLEHSAAHTIDACIIAWEHGSLLWVRQATGDLLTDDDDSSSKPACLGYP